MPATRLMPGALAVALLLAAVTTAYAGPADLDPTFAVGGTLTVPFSGGNSEANAVLVQPDGKIVAAGQGQSDFALVRCNPDGSLDASFGTGGIVTTDFGGGLDVAYGMAQQPDGDLVVAGMGSSPSGLVVARYLSDGTLDPAFGVGGHVLTAGLIANALVLQPDGKIVAGGPGASGFTLVRYLADGTLDASFGTGGLASTDFAPDHGTVPALFALALQPDGKIVAAGGGGSVLALARFASDGTLDATFGSAGQVTTNVAVGIVSTLSSRVQGVVVGADGTITAAGFSAGYIVAPHGNPTPVSVALVGRYAADGAPEGLGPLNSIFTSEAAANAVIQQPDGKIVVAGFDISSTSRHLIMRGTATGGGDPSFFSTGSPPAGASNAVAEQADHKLVAAGFGGTATARTFEIVRYQGGECGDGIVDPFEVCDDGNLTSGDGCDANCTPTGCGNGIVTAGEDCEPQAPGDCCTATCQFADTGAACADNGDLCANHTCDGAGTCQHVEGPSPTCVATAPHESKINVVNAFTARQKLAWVWKGPGVAVDDLDDPTTTPYALCVYDHQPESVTKLALPFPNPPFCVGCWRATPKGFDYKDNFAAYEGVQRILLHASAKGGTFKLKAKGSSIPALGSLPMSVDPTVSVQLRNAAGGCWGAEFGVPKKNDLDTFKANSD